MAYGAEAAEPKSGSLGGLTVLVSELRNHVLADEGAAAVSERVGCLDHGGT